MRNKHYYNILKGLIDVQIFRIYTSWQKILTDVMAIKDKNVLKKKF